MNEKPILFSTPMVQALLREVNPKTQTRMVIVPQPFGIVQQDAGGNWGDVDMMSVELIKPRYRTGDILWVREMFCPSYFDDGSPAYKADYCKERIGDVVPEPKWKPSIHMPRAAARIFLRVTGARVERVQEISEEDAKAEGCVNTHGFIRSPDNEYASPPITATEAFAQLWDSLNAKRGYGWAANPWVWAYTFERVDRPEEGEQL